MTAKSYVITLSVAGAAAALGCWMFLDPAKPETAPAPSPVAKETSPARTRPAIASAKAAPSSQSARKGNRSSAASPAKSAAAAPAAIPAPLENLTPEARAARVEQEANHELRRLVTLLNLDESQQDKVFDTLVRGSRYYSPEMQVAAPGASTSGKRSRQTEALAGSSIVAGSAESTIPGTAGTGTSATTTPVGGTNSTAASDAKVSDPMTEIMSLLTPEQQTALIESEMDRTAWWAEILPQIMPEEVPALDGGASGGNTQQYEGSTTLE